MGDAFSENEALNAEHDAAQRERRAVDHEVPDKLRYWVDVPYHPPPGVRIVAVWAVHDSKSRAVVELDEVDI